MQWHPLRAIRADLKRITDRLDNLERAQRAAQAPEQLRNELAAHDGELRGHETRLLDLDNQVEELNEGAKDIVLAVSEGIERTDRAERRIKATIKRARQQLADHGLAHDGLEAENSELHGIDGARGEAGAVPALPAAVAEPGDEASSVRGVTVTELQSARRQWR